MNGSVWSTREVAPAQVPDYWSRALDQIMPGLHFNPIDKPFEAFLEPRRNIGPLKFNFVCATPQRVVQRRRGRTSPQFGLVFVKSGLIRVRQFARTAEVRASELVMIDGNESAEVITCQDSETLNISVPGAWLQLWLTRPENEVAKAFTPARPEARPLLSLVDLLNTPEAMRGLSEDLVASQFGGSLAIAVGEGDVVGTRHSARLLNRLRQGINAHFFDPAYSPSVAAEEAGISRRYLVSLFALSGTTFNTELIRTRLERSAEMLRDPRFISLSVLDVALRCGFSDASHFSKRFRGRYEMSPACYRLTHLTQMEGLTSGNPVN